MTANKSPDGKPIRLFRDEGALLAWLQKHHAASTGVWLRVAKKASKRKSVTYDQALDVALCFGWIDGQRNREDDDYSIQKFTPRAKRSTWSKRNRRKALALIRAGRMQPAGLAEMRRAKKDGRWKAAYDSPKRMTVPPDLKAALKRRPRAKAFFDTMDGRNRFAILFRLQTAAKAGTRGRRLDRFVAMLERGETLYPALRGAGTK